MPVLFIYSFKTAIFNKLLKVAIAMSNYMNEVYNSVFWREISFSMLKRKPRASSRLYI